VEPSKVYFLIGLTDDDFLTLMIFAKRIGQTREQFIINALKQYVQKVKEELDALEKARPVPVEKDKGVGT